MLSCTAGCCMSPVPGPDLEAAHSISRGKTFGQFPVCEKVPALTKPRVHWKKEGTQKPVGGLLEEAGCTAVMPPPPSTANVRRSLYGPATGRFSVKVIHARKRQRSTLRPHRWKHEQRHAALARYLALRACTAHTEKPQHRVCSARWGPRSRHPTKAHVKKSKRQRACSHRLGSAVHSMAAKPASCLRRSELSQRRWSPLAPLPNYSLIYQSRWTALSLLREVV